MRAIGIDMGKATFVACFPNEETRVYENTDTGMTLFVDTLLERKLTRKNAKIGMEATGVYHLPLATTLHRGGWQAVVINPLISSRAIKDSTLRRIKTDKRDAKIIKDLVIAGYGYPYLADDEVFLLQTRCAQRAALVTMRAQCKQRLHAAIFRSQAMKDREEPFSALIDYLTSEIKRIERAMAGTAVQEQKLIMSITGIGKAAAPLIVAHSGNIERFSSADAYAAYIGLDPRVHQSGTSVHGKGYISKRGNAMLRTALFRCAFIASMHDKDLAAYYTKKRSEGKHHFVILCAIARRLAHRIYAVLKRRTPYEKAPRL